MDEMKKLIIDGQEFEVVDAAGRQRITVLENTAPSGGGLSITEKNLILQLFNKAAYAEDDAGTAYATLSNLWTGSYHSVAWEGTGYTHGNSDVAVEDGESFTSTITANAGKEIESVTVLMGGETVQGAYSSGTVTIPNVSGNIVITVTTAQMTVSSISAVYTQSGTVYDTDSLDVLKPDLVVTATFPDSSTAVIPSTDYTLSGMLLAGTSTITVSYGGKTATFNVTVTAGIVTDGLFAHWDAIDNQATGTHDSTATTWVDKVNGYTWTAMRTDGTKTWAWDDDALVFSPATGNTSGKNTFKCARPNTGLRTLEIVFTPENQIGCVGEFTTDLTGITDNTTQIIGVFPADNTVTSIGVQNGYQVTDITTINSITATYNSSYGAVKLYKNGTEITSQGNSHSFKYHYYSDMILGSQNNSSNLGYGFKGQIHAIRMYSKELTAAEIAQNHAFDVARFGLGA